MFRDDSGTLYIKFGYLMIRYHKHFGTKFRYSNFLCLNCTEVFAETKSFFNIFN